MGLNIGSLLSSVGLPNLNLSSIGSDILSEGKSLLGDVVKDSFTLSNQPGQTFASSMNLSVGGSNVSLPNPIGSLANKLLGDADSELGKIGLNVNFKQVAQELFHLPTQSGSNVTVPSATSRASSNAIPQSFSDLTSAASSGTAGVGGGGGSSGTVSTGTNNSLGTVATASLPTPAGDDGTSALSTADSNLQTQLSSLESQATSGNLSQAQLQNIDQQMQQIDEMMSMISDILKDIHDTKMTIINNIAQ